MQSEEIAAQMNHRSQEEKRWGRVGDCFQKMAGMKVWGQGKNLTTLKN